MDRLDEESADLDFLEENLKKTEALTEKMVCLTFSFCNILNQIYRIIHFF